MDLLNMTKGQINMLSGGLYGKMAGTDIQNRQQTIALAEKIKAGNYGGLGMRPQDMPMPRPDGLGTSTMPRAETAPVSPNRQLAFGLGENLGGAFETGATTAPIAPVTVNRLEDDPNTMVEGAPGVSGFIDITDLAQQSIAARNRGAGIDGPADAEARRQGAGLPTGRRVDPATGYFEDFPLTAFANDAQASISRPANRMGIDGPTDAAALRQSQQLFDRQAERDLTRASSPYFNAPGFEMTPERYQQIQQEKDFDVEETFGSGRKEQREERDLRDQPARQTPNTFVSDNFSSGGQDDVASRGGSVGIGINDSGTTYSENQDGSFTHEDGTSVNFTDSSGKPGNAPTEQEARDARMADRDRQDRQAAAAGSDSGGDSKIVCTEMYRQTQLDDWSQAMKTWYIYQKKYLTPIHEVGYHWLFKPFVRGMKVNNVLTNIGAYFATERTKHLRHVLTKGKSKDSLVGNVFCKIIHPIVYLVGLAVHKK
jgi:hypothetical protein